MEERFKIIVNVASGLETVLKSEVKRAGYGDLPISLGSLETEGTFRDVAFFNVNLRTAERVFILLDRFTAKTFDELYEKVRASDLKRFFNKTAKITVDGKCVKSALFATSACQGMIKKAIVDNLCAAYKISSFPETGEKYQVYFKIVNDEVSLMLNTGGAGLHKRGYENLVGIAPIKETLAAGMVLLSDYYYERPLLDPFCGTCTIPIEAAMIGLNIAPNKDRTFDFNGWRFFDRKAYESVIEEAADRERRDRKLTVFASDIDGKAVEIAKAHLKRAGLEKQVALKRADVKDVYLSEAGGTIVTNPPYGERVIDKKTAFKCYESLGETYRRLKDWSAYVITTDKGFEKRFGGKADRKRKLYNSQLECVYYQYACDKSKYRTDKKDKDGESITT